MRIIQSLLAGIVLLAGTQVQAADLLTIGSEAPKLDVEHWVQNGNGKFEPVTKFESGKVYVVEFWATWCGPCIASMPHLASLQEAYAKRGVQIVSISDEDLETVEKFLEREVRGQGGGHGEEEGEEEGEAAEKQTYRMLTSAYCLTTDPDQSSYEDYMKAAAQNGIPTAFIVGKDAKIEWIGHPMEMDGPLEAVVTDSWDRETFAEEMRARQEAEKAMQEIFSLLQKEEFDEALKLIDGTLAKDESNDQLNMLKLQVLIVAEKTDAAAKQLGTLYESYGDTPGMINQIAWNIYQMSAAGRLKDGEALVGSSIDAVRAAVDKSEGEEKGSIMDTLAHLVFTAGNIDEAIEIETKAIELTGGDNKKFMEDFLAQLQAAKADKETPQEAEAADSNSEDK